MVYPAIFGGNRAGGLMWSGIEIKGLDGERKALVYDNYSKLITATDTIRRVWDEPAAMLREERGLMCGSRCRCGRIWIRLLRRLRRFRQRLRI